MRSILLLSMFLLAVTIGVQPAWAQTSDVVTVTEADQLEWQETPDGASMVALYGDPSQEGPYVLRFKLPANWAGRPHTHGGAELVTIHSGTMYFAYGDDLSREAAKPFGPGDFIALPGGTKMRPYTGDDPVVVDVQGQGPFTTQYLDE